MRVQGHRLGQKHRASTPVDRRRHAPSLKIGGGTVPDVEALNIKAIAARRRGALAEARGYMRNLLALAPDHPALPNLALVLLAADDHRDALVWAKRGVRLTPTRAEAWNILGDAFRASRQYPAAIVAWSQALALNPAMPEAHGNLATLLRDMEYAEQAERSLLRASRVDPTHAGLLTSRVHILQGQNRHAEALRACRLALALAPGFPDAWCDMGLIRQQQSSTQSAAKDAARAFDHALRLKPDHALARFNQGLMALSGGDTKTGWAGYAARFAAGQARPHRRFVIPQWRGEPLGGKRLLVWREQGVGDELLFAAHYWPLITMAAAQGGDVVIECEPRLISLFTRSFPGAVVRAERRAGSGAVEASDCDFHIPAGSLAPMLRRPAGGPAPRWLYADPHREAVWRDQLDGLGAGLRVGIAWRSLLATLNRVGAYAPLAAWEPVLVTPGVSFVNLQLGKCGEEIAVVERRFGTRILVAPQLDLKDDFEDTAALISALDLVIAPAIAVAELSGGLGVPTWRFGQPDWTQLGLAVRPWSPATRVFRPAPGQPLADALSRIAHALRLASGVNAIDRDLSQSMAGA